MWVWFKMSGLLKIPKNWFGETSFLGYFLFFPLRGHGWQYFWQKKTHSLHSTHTLAKNCDFQFLFLIEFWSLPTIRPHSLGENLSTLKYISTIHKNYPPICKITANAKLHRNSLYSLLSAGFELTTSQSWVSHLNTWL